MYRIIITVFFLIAPHSKEVIEKLPPWGAIRKNTIYVVLL
jgi:hypothetical protein